MNSKLFTGLTLAAALLVAGPAFGREDRGGGKSGHAVAASHVRTHSLVAVHSSGGGRHFTASSPGGKRSFRSGAAFASGRTFSGSKAFASTKSNRRSTVAFGGSAYDSRNYSGSGRGGNRYTYAFASHPGWSPGREYAWRGHHYRWYNNGWFIIDPFPLYGPYYGSAGYYGTGSVAVQVQQALSQDGYYRGPVDGVVGPGTSAAIAAYQRDNGLRITGTITPGLLGSLNAG